MLVKVEHKSRNQRVSCLELRHVAHTTHWGGGTNMSKAIQAATLLATIGSLTACSLLPSFDQPVLPASNVVPTVEDLVANIQCQIYKAIDDPVNENRVYDAFTNNRYIAYVNLTADVTNFEGLTPVLNFIHPYVKAATNLTGSIGAQLTGTQHRTINQTFTIDLDRDKINKDQLQACSVHRTGRFGLSGDLGFLEIIRSGINYNTKDDFLFPIPQVGDAGAGSAKLSASLIPVFSSTIDFTVIYGIGNAGPTFTLTHFKGPGGGSQGLLNLTRTEKDTLVISFASAGAKTEAAKALIAGPRVSPEAAASAAQDAATRMILQNVLPQTLP
jgi:hypothetical protein